MNGLVPLITVTVMRSTVNGLVSLITVSVMKVVPTRFDKQHLSFVQEGWPLLKLERTKCQKAWNEVKTGRLMVLAVDHLTLKGFG